MAAPRARALCTPAEGALRRGGSRVCLGHQGALRRQTPERHLRVRARQHAIKGSLRQGLNAPRFLNFRQFRRKRTRYARAGLRQFRQCCTSHRRCTSVGIATAGYVLASPFPTAYSSQSCSTPLLPGHCSAGVAPRLPLRGSGAIHANLVYSSFWSYCLRRVRIFEYDFLLPLLAKR